MSAIHHIVFDIGHVLLHFDPASAYEEAIPDSDERSAFLSEICNVDWIAEQDRGRSWAEGENLLIERHPEKAALIRRFRTHWREMVPHAHDDAVATMRSLIAEGFDVTLLSNISADKFEEARALYPFQSEPRGATVSGAIGLIKPDPAIYRHHEETFGLEPEATLFIDDNARNIEAAQQCGWNVVHHRPGAAVAPLLQDFGLTLGTESS
ncbi:MAG: HAD family phosphatase [Pseudomonadota bacterium]